MTTTTTTTTTAVVGSPNELDYALQNVGGGGGQQQQISLLLDATRTSVNDDLIGFSQVLRKFKFSLKPLHLGIVGTTTITRGSVTASIIKHHYDEFRHSVIDHDHAARHSSIHLLQQSDNQMNGSGNTTESNHSQHHQKLLAEFFQGIGKLRGLQKLELRNLQVDLNHLTLLLQEGPTQLVSLKMEEMKFSNNSTNQSDNKDDDTVAVQRFVSALQDLPNLRRIQLWIPPNQLQLDNNKEGGGGGGGGGLLLSKVSLGLVTKLTNTKSNCMISVGPEVHKPRPNNIWEALERQRKGVDLYVNDIQLGTAALMAAGSCTTFPAHGGGGGGGLSLLYVIIGPNVHWTQQQAGMISSFCQALVQNKTLETLVLYVRPTSAWSFIEQVVSILPQLVSLQSLVIRCSDMTSNNNKMKCLFDNLDHALETNYILRDISVYDMNSKDHKRQIYHSTRKDLFLRLNYPHGGFSGGVLASRKDMLSLLRTNNQTMATVVPASSSGEKWIHQFTVLNQEEDIDGLYYYTYQYMTQIHAGTTTTPPPPTEEQPASTQHIETTTTTIIDSDGHDNSQKTTNTMMTTRTCIPKPSKQVVHDDDDDDSARTATTTTSTCAPNSPKQVFDDDDGDGNSGKAMTATAEAATTAEAVCIPKPRKQAVNDDAGEGNGSSKTTTSTTKITSNPPTNIVHKRSDNSGSRITTPTTSAACFPNPVVEVKTTRNNDDGDGNSRKTKMTTTTATTTSIPKPPKQVVVVVVDDNDDDDADGTSREATTTATTACLPNPPKQLAVNYAPGVCPRKTTTSTNITSNPPISSFHNENSGGGGSRKSTRTTTPTNPSKQAVHKNKKERTRRDHKNNKRNTDGIFYVRIVAMALVGFMAVTNNQRGR